MAIGQDPALDAELNHMLAKGAAEAGGLGLDEPVTVDELGTFQDDYAKVIDTEAETAHFYHPKAGDVVSVRVGADGPVHTRVVKPPQQSDIVEGLELDRSVATMRLGEVATFTRKVSHGQEERRPVQLTLLGLVRRERVEDGVEKLVLQSGEGHKQPSFERRAELRVRYACRAAPETQAVAGGCQVVLGAGVRGDEALLSQLRRSLLRRHGGPVVQSSHADGAASEAKPILKVTVGGEVLAEAQEGLAPEEVLQKLGSGAQAKEVSVKSTTGRLECPEQDWLPADLAWRALADMKVNSRYILCIDGPAVAPELRTSLNLAEGQGVEYNLELLQIMSIDDMSLALDGSVLKKLVHEEPERGVKAEEGAKVTLKLRAAHATTGQELLAERELALKAGNGEHCSALDESVLHMRKGDICEVHCSDPLACADAKLGLSQQAPVTFFVQVLEVEKLDLYELPEIERVKVCEGRKEVGSKFVKEQNWLRAMRRYQAVTKVLEYSSFWKDEKAKAEAGRVKKACNLNLSLCHLKLGQWKEADHCCVLVLKEEAGNVKAIFRRAQAKKELGEYEDAEKALKALLEIDPENAAAKDLRNQVVQHLRAQRKKEKEVYSRMTQQKMKKAEPRPEGEANGKSNGASAAAADEADDDDSCVMLSIAAAVLAGVGAAAYYLKRKS